MYCFSSLKKMYCFLNITKWILRFFFIIIFQELKKYQINNWGRKNFNLECLHWKVPTLLGIIIIRIIKNTLVHSFHLFVLYNVWFYIATVMTILSKGHKMLKTQNTRHSPCRPIMLFSIFLFMELAQAQEILIEKLKEYGM